MMYGMRQKYMRDLIVKILVRLGLYKPVVELINKVKSEVQAQRMRKNGLKMLKAADENYLNESYPMFFSSNTNIGGNPKPRFIIEYRNNNGLESYWDYKKQVYSSGNAYVNTHTGNLTTMFKLGHTVGGSFPAHLELVYNTNDVILNNQTFFGKGYKLSLEQEIIIHNDQLEYIDGDGTSHFFNKHDSNSNLYYDNDGLKLTIEEQFIYMHVRLRLK